MNNSGKKGAARRKEAAQAAAGAAVNTVIKVVIIVVAVMVIYKIGSSAYSYGERIFGEEPVSAAPGQDIVFTVSSADSVRDVAKNLESIGLIRDSGMFAIQEKLYGFKNGIQPGTYTLNTSQTAEDMLEIMTVENKDPEEEAAKDSQTQEKASEGTTETQQEQTSEGDAKE